MPAADPLAAIVRAWLIGAADRIVANADELSELDARIGDGDHGINLGRGMARVRQSIVDLPSGVAADEVLRSSGRLLISTVGGASGPLYGTFLVEASDGMAARASEDDGAALGAALASGCAGVGRRGRSTTGQKTMLDTLVPATEAFVLATAAGADLRAAGVAALAAARTGREGTRDMIALRGRASYLGERSIGHLDPGASSSLLVIEALAAAIDVNA